MDGCCESASIRNGKKIQSGAPANNELSIIQELNPSKQQQGIGHNNQNTSRASTNPLVARKRSVIRGSAKTGTLGLAAAPQ